MSSSAASAGLFSSVILGSPWGQFPVSVSLAFRASVAMQSASSGGCAPGLQVFLKATAYCNTVWYILQCLGMARKRAHFDAIGAQIVPKGYASTTQCARISPIPKSGRVREGGRGYPCLSSRGGVLL